MFKNHYYYTRLALKDLDMIVKAFQERFEDSLQDNFDDHELEVYEKQIDAMAAIFVQPILEELTFEDFYPDPTSEQKQRDFFSSCRSSITVENIPYLDTNPFQVSYLRELLALFDEVLIDSGGTETLQFKAPYLARLDRYTSMDSLLADYVPREASPKRSASPIHPMDFLVRDVYKEIKIASGHEELSTLPPKMRIIFEVMQEPDLDAEDLMLRSRLIPKDFGDSLESLKFFLKRLNKVG